MQVGDLPDLEKPKAKRGQIVLGRIGSKVWINTLDLMPSDRFKFELIENELTIKVTLNDGEFIGLKDQDGIAERKFICGSD